MTEPVGAGVMERIFSNVRRVIVGKDDRIRNVLACWLSGGHILIEDLPGTGKTILARALAQSVQTEFKRVQFTPDLLPSDVTGTAVYSQKKGAFEFMKGPVFTSVFLADEINRATPRTQSALLEAMAEGQVTAEGTTFALDPLFFTIATQNPIEQHGTFPLPEAQLDRFMMKISMGYPQPAEEIAIAKGQNRAHPIHSLQPVANAEDLRAMRARVPEVQVHDAIYEYAMNIVAATRSHPELRLGASPRATLALIRAAQATALLEGQNYVRPTHVFNLAPAILGHRVGLTTEARISGKNSASVVDAIIKSVPAPVSK